MYTRDRSRPGGLFGIRKLGWLAVASMLALAMIGPGTGVALGATQGWAGNGWPVKEDCKDAAPGTTVWIWTGDSPTALTVNGVAQAGSLAAVPAADRRRGKFVVAMVRHRARPCDHVRDLHG